MLVQKDLELIADGHLDLNRKLDEALKVESEKEITAPPSNINIADLRKQINVSFVVHPASAHSNECKSRIRPAVGRI